MVVADITLTNTNVNSGTSVIMGGAGVKYTWKTISVPNTVAKKFDIAASTFAGFEAPVIVISGTIPIDDNITNHVSQKLLIDLAAEKTADTTLKITAGKTGGTVLGGRPSGGYKTDGTNTLDSNGIKVQILGFTLAFSTSTLEGHMWEYTINCRETT